MIPTPEAPLRIDARTQDVVKSAQRWARVSFLPSILVLAMMVLALLAIVFGGDDPELTTPRLMAAGTALFIASLVPYVVTTSRFIRAAEQMKRGQPAAIRKTFRALHHWWVASAFSALAILALGVMTLVAELMGITIGAAP